MLNRTTLASLVLLLFLTVPTFSGLYASSAGTQAPAAAPAGEPIFKSIPPTEAKQIIDQRKNLVLIDVRSPEELREGAIAGSKLVPMWAIFKNQLTLPHDAPVMLICAVGGRSYAAGQMMYRYGFKEVYNLSGGIDAWKKAGLPVVY